MRRRSEVELGPKKIQALVERRYPGQSPSRTTIYTILKLEGLIAPPPDEFAVGYRVIQNR